MLIALNASNLMNILVLTFDILRAVKMLNVTFDQTLG
jgi:hypothetical protein